MIKVVKKRLDFFDSLFLLFILCIVISNVIWFKIDNSIIGNDSDRYLLFSIDFFYRFSDVLHSNANIFKKTLDIINVIAMPGRGYTYWPQGLSLTAFIFYFLLGKSLFAAKMTILLYLLVLLFSTYSIGKLLHSKFTGLIAVILLSFYPIIFQSARQYQLDLPLTSLVTLIMYLLLKVDRFNNAKYSLLLGFACGFSMLIKGQAILFIAFAFVYMLYRSGPFKPKQLRNLFAALLISALIASVWWGPRINAAILRLKTHIIDPGINYSFNSPFSWGRKYSVESVFFHLKELFYSSLRPFFGLLFIILFTPFIIQKIKHKGLYISWIIPPLLLFSLAFTVKHSRFLMPILPALALITALGLEHLQNKRAKSFILAISIIFAFLQFYVLSYAEDKYRVASIGHFKIFGESGFGSDYEVGKPCNEEPKIDAVANIIQDNKTVGKAYSVLIIDMCKVNPKYCEMFFRLKLKDRSLIPVSLSDLFNSSGRFDCVDFIISRTFSQNPVNWFEAGKYRKRFNSDYFIELEHFESELQKSGQMREWEGFLKNMEESVSNFCLIDKVIERNTTYYIYKTKIFKQRN